MWPVFTQEKVELDQAEDIGKRAETPWNLTLKRASGNWDAARQGAAWIAQYRINLKPFIDKISNDITEDRAVDEDIVKNGIKPETKMPPDGKWGPALQVDKAI